MPEQLERSVVHERDVNHLKRDGLYLLILGSAVFLLFGFVLQYSASDSREDFRAVVYGSRCLLQHCDPYNQEDLFRFYERELGTAAASHFRGHTLTLYVNLPTTILLTAPFAILPFGVSSLLWSTITAASFILASFLIWKLSSTYAPVLSAGLIAISLMSGAIVLGNGNPAGIVIPFCLIAVGCFLKDRFALAGVLCLSISLALKPHDAGLVWLYFLLAGGKLRKRAIHTLAVSSLLIVAAVLWVSETAPNWLPELRSNMVTMAAHGGNNDPGPAGPTSRDRAIETIVNLQSAVSWVNDDPRFYNAITFTVCGFMFLSWIVGIFLFPRTMAGTWLALASIAPLTMLVTYHRAYDTRLLMLGIPACVMLAAEKGKTGSAAVLISTLGLIFTGELPYALVRPLLGRIQTSMEGSSSMATLCLNRPAPLVLLLMSGFYLWVFLRRSSQRNDQLLRA
jgi:glycosyl transferase family 87